MMFSALKPLILGGSLNLTLTGNADDTITVLVAPKGAGVLSQPLVLTATAAELDAEFAQCIQNFANQRKGLADQLEATAAILDAAKKESAEKGVKAITKQSTPAAASTIVAKTTSNSDLDDEDDEGGDDLNTGSTEVAPSASTVGEPPATMPNLFL